MTRKCPCVAETERNPYRSCELADDNCDFCGGTGELKIRTEYVHPPIPDRTSDWAAWIDGDEEWLMAYGATKQQAIDALLERIAEVEE